jgi:cytoskeletal protein RodZ
LSEDLWVADPETEHRRRALWGLTILGLAAVIVVALMVFLIGTSGGNDNNGIPNTRGIPELSTTPGSGQHSSTHSSSSSSHSSSASTSASTPATTKCSSGTSCTLEGDAGHVIDAINNFRKSNGQAAVSGTATQEAMACSLNYGNTGCPTSYFWEPVFPQDGSAVVEKIASRSDGRSFLLSPSMKSVQIGWAYVGGQYSCTIALVS